MNLTRYAVRAALVLAIAVALPYVIRGFVYVILTADEAFSDWILNGIAGPILLPVAFALPIWFMIVAHDADRAN